ncbi:MAG: hypothetical protein ACRDV1_01325 [Actinomycetes bacterium]
MTRKPSDLARRLLRSRRLEALDRRLANTEERLTRQSERLKRYDERLKRQGERLKGQGERLKGHGEQLREHREVLKDVRRAATSAHNLFEILASQVGGIEERLQSLTEKVELDRYDATDEETAEARSLVEAIREEHRRIRVRFGVVARYEERLRRLESALAEEMAAAAELAREAARNGAVARAVTHGAVDISEDPTEEARPTRREETPPATPGP